MFIMTSAAQAQPACLGEPFSASATATGTILNRESAKAIITSAQRRLSRNWRAIAHKRYGPRYTKVKSGICRCTVNTKTFTPGTRLRVTCVGTAPACSVGQFFRVRFSVSHQN